MKCNKLNISAVDKEFFHYFVHLDEIQKRTMLEMLKAFLKQSSVGRGNLSMDLYNMEIDEAMERIGHGKFTSLEDLEKEMEGW